MQIAPKHQVYAENETLLIGYEETGADRTNGEFPPFRFSKRKSARGPR